MTNNSMLLVPKWGRFEKSFTSAVVYANALNDVSFSVWFTAPSGIEYEVNGFWDGDANWRVRFSPNEMGTWTYHTSCTDKQNAGLSDQTGTFQCEHSSKLTRFDRHGPIRLSKNRRYFVHEDGTPFFWLADTGWNGPLRATLEEWDDYLRCRLEQKFTAIQWVTTQWVASPEGDINDESAFTGDTCITINSRFFQRLDKYIDAINAVGLLASPVLLWAVRANNPGYDLPEDQAVLLARYMIARWQAHHVAWTLAGDGDYREDKFAQRWRRIGRAVFTNNHRALVTMHPGGMVWILDEFLHEDWYDFVGYQSGHGDDDHTFNWLVKGPPATDWTKMPNHPIINMEPPYEDHISYQSRTRLDALTVRRALYWSLLVSPTAGVTYGGHGVWGWDNGTEAPVGHPSTGIPIPWRQALVMPAAQQVAHLHHLFDSIDWWRLRPASELLIQQAGDINIKHFIAVSCTDNFDLAVVYIPQDRNVSLNLSAFPLDLSAFWFNPQTGDWHTAVSEGIISQLQFKTPDEGDWILVIGRTISLPAKSNA